jgi:lipid A disaccharide synthetase
MIILILVLQRKIVDTVDAAILFRPHAIVTIDSKGFSFRLLQQLKCKIFSGSILYHTIISFKQPNLHLFSMSKPGKVFLLSR